MHEEVLKSIFRQAVGQVEVPQSLWQNIQTRLARKRKRAAVRRRVVAAIAGIVLIFTVSIGSITPVGAAAQKTWLFKNVLGSATLTIAQNIGENVAELTPTLFLPTTLAHAKQVARMHIKVPEYLPAGTEIGPDTPTLVGRVGSIETIAIKVSDNRVKLKDGSGEVILLDIRETNAKDLEVSYGSDVAITTREVKINGDAGVVVSGEGLAPVLHWNDGQYTYRIFGPSSEEELIKIAESMK